MGEYQIQPIIAKFVTESFSQFLLVEIGNNPKPVTGSQFLLVKIGTNQEVVTVGKKFQTKPNSQPVFAACLIESYFHSPPPTSCPRIETFFKH